MKTRAALILGIISLAAAPVASGQNFNRLGASLVGFDEVPSVSTGASGKFDAQINNHETAIDYELSYTDLEGDVLQAHIHFGQPGVNGGITVFLCTNLGNGRAGVTPACPPSPASVSGTITADDVSTTAAAAGAVTQGIGPGEFAELVRAIRAGATYANVHSARWPGGEIRNQVGPGHSH